MKITRLVRGFRIGCSDTEFELLRLLAERGLRELTNSSSAATLPIPVQRTLYSGKFGDLGGLFRVDVDRRDPEVVYGGPIKVVSRMSPG
ncbi:MAG TPA: hypothetical protein VMU82_05310 [Acetobacteraceae bacterium]|nr:hypothetical protein [Acetobacteraceae bacterium]